MFAVIKAGGKQYKVVANDEIVVERLDGEPGDEHAFDDVIMLGEGEEITLGEPTVKGAAVVGEVVEQTRDEKIIIFKKRQRSTYRRKKGHRQLKTVIKITAILPDGADVKKLKKAGKKTTEVETKDLKEADTVAKAEKKAAKAKKKEAEAPKAETPKVEAPKAEAAPAPKTEAPVAAPAEGLKALDERGRLKEAMGEADDLKQIKGVGKVLEGKLNAAGIFHFWQVAALTEEQITDLEGDMSFPGRIGRDNWVDQAKELAND